MTRPRKAGPDGVPATVASLARGLALLRAFRPEDRGLSNRELAERTGLPPSTVSRLTGTLVELGFLDHDPGSGRYALTASVAALGCLPPRAALFRFNVGSRLPLARTAMGRAYLAGLDEVRFARCMDEIRAMGEDHWPRLLADVEKARADIAERGFCSSFSEWESGLNAVGVPVLVNGGREVFAVSCGAPSYSLDPEELSSLHGPRLVELVNSVTDRE